MKKDVMGRILVVDDDDWIVTGARTVLETQGFEVSSAGTGAEGLDRARDQCPDLIITDVVMPEMDGWTFVRQLRADPRFALVPVLFLTSKASAQDRISGFQLGADDYLSKPLNLHELPRRVLKALAQRRLIEAEMALGAKPAPGGGGLKGTLDQIGMASLLSVLAMSRRSGILRLSRPMGTDEILIYLVRGELHRIEMQGRGRLNIEEVFQQLFHWFQGTFEFLPMKLRLSNELNLSMNTLLLQGARQGAFIATPA
ncbi:MAG TPA: response regulator [Planctomycetota bacterium]|nr:response regulator [Planctomycetota bacterium]